jgi:uncharacterized protein (UPF0335 family)
MALQLQNGETEMTEPTIGDNSQLKSIVERIEHVEGEIKDLQTGRGEIYQEAKSNGLDVKALRTIVRMRKESPDDRANREAILETYMHALGMS